MSLKKEPLPKLSLWLRVLLSGEPGTGKTFLGLHFPDLIVLDTERGTDAYTDMFDFVSCKIGSVEDLLEQVEYLESGDHKFKTLMVDSLSDIYDYHQNDLAKIIGSDEFSETETGVSLYGFQLKDYRLVNADYRELMRRVTGLKMNVICTAQETAEYKDGAVMVPTGGKRPAAGKNLGRFFDTVIRLYNREGQYLAWCTKDRTRRVPMLRELEIDYNVFAGLVGEEVLNQPAQANPRCSNEQRKLIKSLAESGGISQSSIHKALKEYNVEKMTELTAEQADALIGRLSAYREKVTNGAS